MSAYIQTRAHIAALVRLSIEGPSDRGPSYPGDGWHGPYFGDRGPVTGETADELARMLWAENVESVAYRYPDDSDDDRPGRIADGSRYDWRPVVRDGRPFDYQRAEARPLTRAEAVLAIRGLEYQSCEHPGWRTSEAYHFLNTLLWCVAASFPGVSEADTWTVDDPREAVA